MVTYSIIGIFVLIIALFIYFGNNNKNSHIEDKHKEKNEDIRAKKDGKSSEKDESEPRVNKKTTNYVVQPRKVASAKEIRDADEKKLEQEKRKIEKQRREEQRLEKLRLKEKKLQEKKAKREQEKHLAEEKSEEVKLKPQQEVQTKTAPEAKVEIVEEVKLPECKYPKFDYSRLLQMGLGEDEAMEFIRELIPQIQTQIPLIQKALDASDFHNVERLTHSIKGSSTTVGTGGVADLLVEFNTYVKTEKEIPVLEAYLKHLKYYCEELAKEYA